MLPRISGEEAALLERRPSGEEVKEAVYDGYNFNFIKNMWDVIGEEIVDFVLSFFENGVFPNEINMTWVTLILKVDDAQELGQYNLSGW